MRHRLNFLLASEKASLFRSFYLASSLVALLMLAGTQFARADSQVRAVRLSNVSGSVQVATGGQTALQQAYANMPLTEGSHLQTGDDGRAEIQFEDGSVARLTPNTSLTMSELRRDGSGAPVNGMQVLAGLAYFETASQNQQPYLIQFANAQVTPAKGSIFRVNLDANPAEVAVLHGSVHLASGTSYDVSVRANETVHLDASDPTRYQLAEGVNGDSWDEWNSDRDAALAAMASRETREAMLNGGTAGWSDLDYYGNWYNVPGYGNVWSPYGMTANWDPYGSGYWGFYQGPGYVWVSGYPWGWTPYRCGNWNYFNSYGWGWSPGGCGGGGWGFGGPGDYGSGGVFIGTPPRNYRLPQRPTRPHPVAPGSNQAATMIAVNRGPEATRLQPRPIGRGGNAAGDSGWWAEDHADSEDLQCQRRCASRGGSPGSQHFVARRQRIGNSSDVRSRDASVDQSSRGDGSVLFAAVGRIAGSGAISPQRAGGFLPSQRIVRRLVSPQCITQHV